MDHCRTGAGITVGRGRDYSKKGGDHRGREEAGPGAKGRGAPPGPSQARRNSLEPQCCEATLSMEPQAWAFLVPPSECGAPTTSFH